jgi:hypothetical protein
MCPVTFTALAVSAGITGTAAAVVGTAVSGALIGMGTTAAMNVATGQSITSGMGKAALFGGISGGLSGGINPAGYLPGLQPGIGAPLGVFPAAQVAAYPTLTAMAPTWGSIALGGAAGSLMNAMTPDPSQFGYGAQPYQALNVQHTKVTGSGGRQAAAVLASEIKQAKSLRKRQAAAEDYGLGTSLSGSGLQIA